MRIALYYPWIYLRSGVERTILELVKRSRHNWTIFTSHFDKEGTYPEFKDLEVIQLKRISVKRSYLEVLKAVITIILQKIDLKNYDILWVHSEGLGDLINFRNHSKPVICFCHTPLKIIHDPYTRRLYLKNNYLKFPLFIIASFIFKLIDRSAWHNYRYIFCTSKEIKERILNAKLAKEEKIEIIYRGLNLEKIMPTWIYEPYFLIVSRIKWWKNIELGIEAFDLFQRKAPQFYNFKLIIAGQVDAGSKIYYQKLVKLASINRDIKIIPNPKEDELCSLYKNCYCVLSTTLCEDFGISIIEAMGYGKPVIAVNRGGPKEIIVDKKTGFLVEPKKEEFAKKMFVLASSKELVIEMGRQARYESLKYDWNNFVKRIDDFLDSLK